MSLLSSAPGQVRRKQGIRELLMAIETGDPRAVAVVDEGRYIQHNPQTHEGTEGLAALFARISKMNPRVNLVRVFADGDFVFAHTEYDFSTRRIGFEVFRFDGEQAVEHWDNIQPRRGPNASGRTMVDGPHEAEDLEHTEANRARVVAYVEQVLLADSPERAPEYVAPDLAQHHPELGDGREALLDHLAERHDSAAGTVPAMHYERLHRTLADGNFVLTVCEGELRGVHTSFYDLYRLSAGTIVEHWCTIEAVPDPAQWKNANGKF